MWTSERKQLHCLDIGERMEREGVDVIVSRPHLTGNPHFVTGNIWFFTCIEGDC
jgi:hypothetical protein